MYIKSVDIKNIRSISHFEMSFPNPAGWHVLIGDNGAGKSSILQSIALAIADSFTVNDISFYLGLYTNNWLRIGTEQGKIAIEIEGDYKYDDHSNYRGTKSLLNKKELEIRADSWGEETKFSREVNYLGWKKEKSYRESYANRGIGDNIKQVVDFGWFAASFGPYRRFKGDDGNLAKVEETAPRLSPHLSIFGESVAFPSTVQWIIKLHINRLEKKKEDTETLEALTKFINQSKMFPNGMTLDNISSKGVYFKNSDGLIIELNQISDGYRSIISLTFEIIRQLLRVFNYQDVFKEVLVGGTTINLPGVILVDEIDVHLHPTWQTQIGHWFTKYFPKIQFIVTSHSPLVCRACENGSIWRLAAPGSGNESGEITGTNKQRLIYGNVLDAYGTEVFGENVSISKEGDNKLSRLTELNQKSIEGETTDHEEKELMELKSFLTPIL